ncbi:hypothetical protein SAY87_009350 [Trapa incisa]|uniref:Uncharacterized protein n=2 Tax=Trapa TaxID=22665 RepID=A0AAN7RHP0_TRANT|nr:hypothetical protein SAY87_009350 [Trapa incisa]KAK4798751.1 hypothetical protein SAY86_031077 [Trapa natans]
MTDSRNPTAGASSEPHSPSPSPSSSSRPPLEIHSNGGGGSQSSAPFSGHNFRYPNPREVTNPDPVTLREQWRFVTRQYARWYSHAWGTAILAGAAFFALGWIVKGGNPLPSFQEKPPEPAAQSPPHEKKNEFG